MRLIRVALIIMAVSLVAGLLYAEGESAIKTQGEPISVIPGKATDQVMTEKGAVENNIAIKNDIQVIGDKPVNPAAKMISEADISGSVTNVAPKPIEGIEYGALYLKDKESIPIPVISAPELKDEPVNRYKNPVEIEPIIPSSELKDEPINKRGNPVQDLPIIPAPEFNNMPLDKYITTGAAFTIQAKVESVEISAGDKEVKKAENVKQKDGKKADASRRQQQQRNELRKLIGGSDEPDIR